MTEEKDIFPKLLSIGILMDAIKQLARKHKAILLDFGFKEKSDDGLGNIQPQYDQER